MDLTLFMYLIPSLIMFGCGVYGFITRKNMIAIMISLELMLTNDYAIKFSNSSCSITPADVPVPGTCRGENG